MRYMLGILLSVLCVGSIVLYCTGGEGGEDTDTEYKRAAQELPEIYSDRAEHVSQTCGKYKREISDRYRLFWPKENYQTVLGRADVFFNKKIGFLWCRVPKAASESWTGVFIKKWFRKSRSLTMANQQAVLRRAWRPRQNTAGYIRQTARRSLSFMTTRHPLERLLSAYRDKFFLNGDFDFERKKVNRWYILYGRDIIANYRKTTPTDTKYKKAPTFREFIEYLVELPINKFESHWIPMYLQCMPCHIQYSIMARLDTLTRDSDQIFLSMGVSAHLPRSHVTQGNTTDNTVATYYSQISKDLLDKLLDIYKFDFLLFDYTADEYSSYVKE